MNTADLTKLPAVEKLKLVTMLWDEIASDRESLVVPSEVIAEAVRRSSEIQSDPSIGIDDEELWHRVDG